MKAAKRREIADQFAIAAVDLAEKLPEDPIPEDLMDMQHELEDLFYRELARVT
jgi:hypothetical protein